MRLRRKLVEQAVTAQISRTLVAEKFSWFVMLPTRRALRRHLLQAPDKTPEITVPVQLDGITSPQIMPAIWARRMCLQPMSKTVTAHNPRAAWKHGWLLHKVQAEKTREILGQSLDRGRLLCRAVHQKCQTDSLQFVIHSNISDGFNSR
jgi:hypothetical protein